MAGTFWKVNQGNDWNPLCGFPRNAACFCGSGLKHKRCCADKVLEYCGFKKAAELRRLMPQILAGKIRVALGDTDSNPKVLTDPQK
jgi:SEC-C motif-containing protein